MYDIITYINLDTIESDQWQHWQQGKKQHFDNQVTTANICYKVETTICRRTDLKKTLTTCHWNGQHTRPRGASHASTMRGCAAALDRNTPLPWMTWIFLKIRWWYHGIFCGFIANFNIFWLCKCSMWVAICRVILGVGTKAQSVLVDTQTYNTTLETPLGWRILAQLMFVGVVIWDIWKDPIDMDP